MFLDLQNERSISLQFFVQEWPCLPNTIVSLKSFYVGSRDAQRKKHFRQKSFTKSRRPDFRSSHKQASCGPFVRYRTINFFKHQLIKVVSRYSFPSILPVSLRCDGVTLVRHAMFSCFREIMKKRVFMLDAFLLSMKPSLYIVENFANRFENDYK